MSKEGALEKAMKMIMEKAKEESEIGRFASTLLPLLREAADKMRRSEMVRPSRRGTGKITYLVEKTQQGDVLTESKGSGSKPYRCPKHVYDALASVLAAAERPLLLDEISEAMESEIGDRPADHQIRIALRLWLHIDPPLIARNRSRYRRLSSGSLTAATATTWKKLSS